MDFLLELIVQVFGELLLELLGRVLRGMFGTMLSALGRRAAGWVMGLALGVAAGYLWGEHLSGGHTWPKLLWVSAGLGVTAFVLGLQRSGAWPDEPQAVSWRRLLVAPWRWDTERLFGFALINVGIVVGIALGFGPSWVPLP